MVEMDEILDELVSYWQSVHVTEGSLRRCQNRN